MGQYKDSWFLLKDMKTIARVKYIKGDQKYTCNTVRMIKLSNLFTDPVQSSLFNILFFGKSVKVGSVCLHKDDLLCKMVSLPYKDGFALFPLLHELGDKI